jgi:outer membrane lipoprotein-sorting protein
MKNKAIVWAFFGVGLVLICSVVYFTDPARRREPPAAVITDKSSDAACQAEPNEVTSQTEPNEAVAQAEPNKIKPQTASVKDTFKDEPEAHALFDKMIETMRNAESLSYKGDCGNCTYMIWMKKPNYFRVETVNRQGVECGTIVGDGDNLWIYWPEDRPHFSSEDRDSYEKTASKVYMKEATPIGRHSIGHKTGLLGAGMGMTIIDPSTFHGYTDSLQPYLDGVRSWEAESIKGHECDVIEVSFMKRQRIWYIWLSRQDHLPRKLKEVVRVSRPLIGYEYWSDVTINAEIPDEKFVWSPPAGWQQWTLPDIDEKLLKPGTEAPDFELLLADETKTRLSDYRGKIVWFYMWRVG